MIVGVSVEDPWADEPDVWDDPAPEQRSVPMRRRRWVQVTVLVTAAAMVLTVVADLIWVAQR